MEMGGFIPDNIIEDILGRIDIVEIISSYFPLRKAGRNFKALCPFHKEKTPSFMVSPDKQIFHCFGCSEGGNVIHFLMKHERLEFPDAVRLLAKRSGVVIPEVKKETAPTLGLFRINDAALHFYHENLVNSPQAEGVRQYLLKRGLSKEAWTRFKLGFAPPQGEALVNFLKQKGIGGELAAGSGLIVRRENKEGFFDFFRGRIIYPIFDIRQRVLGFGGRVLDDSLPKYINSPETAVYKKGETLYGLNFSREAIREKGFTIIVEGYMDLISLFQAGFSNIVAALGTALTGEQVRLIKRFSPSVVVVYDGDKAGELAALRGLELLLEAGLDIKLVALPKGLDPDSFVRLKGRDGFASMLKEAKNIFEYKLQLLLRQYDIANLEEKLKVVKEMLPTISRVENAVLRGEYVKQLAARLSVSEENIRIELKKIIQPAGGRPLIKEEPRAADAVLVFSSIREAEATLLKLMLKERSYIKQVKERLGKDAFINPQIRKAIDLLYTIDEEGRSIEPSKIVSHLSDNPTNRVVTRLLLEEDFGSGYEDSGLVFDDCVKKLKEDNRRRMCQQIKEEIHTAQEKGNAGRVEELLREFNALARQIN